MAPLPRAAVDAQRVLLEELRASGASAATVRQRSWALDQAIAFAAEELASRHLGERSAGELRSVVYVDDLLTPDFIDRFLTAGKQGRLNAVKREPERTEANTRARVATLRLLAARTESPIPAHPVQTQMPRPILDRHEFSAVLNYLAGPARGQNPRPSDVRLSAVLAVMLASPMRTHELVTLTTGSLLLDGDGRPHALDRGEGHPSVPLSGVAVSILQEWLLVRNDFVTRLEGTHHDRLWVAVHTVPTPGRPWAAGLPLHARGLQRAFRSAVQDANIRHAGQQGFPLPTSLDLVRRTIEGRRTT